MGTTENQELLEGVFEDLALSIGGLIHSFKVPDAFTWRLFQSMESLREKALVLTADGNAESAGNHLVGSLQPHPAAEQFLRRIRERDSIK